MGGKKCNFMDHTLMVSLSWNEYTAELGATEHSAKVSKNAGILAFMSNWIYLKNNCNNWFNKVELFASKQFLHTKLQRLNDT